MLIKWAPDVSHCSGVAYIAIIGVATLETKSNGAFHPGGHFWDHYPGTHSFSQVCETHLKIGYP